MASQWPLGSSSNRKAGAILEFAILACTARSNCAPDARVRSACPPGPTVAVSLRPPNMASPCISLTSYTEFPAVQASVRQKLLVMAHLKAPEAGLTCNPISQFQCPYWKYGDSTGNVSNLCGVPKVFIPLCLLTRLPPPQHGPLLTLQVLPQWFQK